MSISKVNKTPNLLIFLLFLNIFINTFSFTSILLTKGLYLLIGSISLCYTVNKKGFRKNNFFIFLLLYTIAFIISYIYNSNSDFIEILWPLGFMSIGYMLANFKVSHRIVSFVFYLYMILVILISLTYKNVKIFSSLNGINVNIFVLLSLYYITRDYNNELRNKIILMPVIFAIITVVILSLNFLGGRSGTITFIFILILFLMARFLSNKRSKFINFVFIFVPGSLVFYQIFGAMLTKILKILTSRGIGSIRYQIWHDYFLKTNDTIANVIFGARISGTELLDNFAENLHNALFMLHAKYGIFMLMLVLFMFAITLLKYLLKRDILHFTLFTAMIIRMFFDYTNFNAILDILLIYFIFNTHNSASLHFHLTSKNLERTSVSEIF